MDCEFEDLWVCQRNVNSSRLKAARLGNISLTLSLLRNYLSIHFPVTFNIFLCGVLEEAMTKTPLVFWPLMSSSGEQRVEGKIGYFSLVTRALDDSELKTCKQHSRALTLSNIRTPGFYPNQPNQPVLRLINTLSPTSLLLGKESSREL